MTEWEAVWKPFIMIGGFIAFAIIIVIIWLATKYLLNKEKKKS